MKHLAYLLVGSNIDKERCYPRGIALIASLGEVLALSPVYETAPVGMNGVGNFFNGAVLLGTDLDPEVLKSQLLTRVEEPLGRVRGTSPVPRPRTMDVDIALWDDFVGHIAGRPVPDPDILRHTHAARPLADIAPDLRHPVDGRTLAEIAADLQKPGPLPRKRPDIILEL